MSKPIWDDERISAWKDETRRECEAVGAPQASLLRAYGDLPYAMAEEYESALTALSTKLTATEAERDELYETVSTLGNQIEAVNLSVAATHQDVIALVERLLDEARDQGHRTVIWPETYSRRWLMRRLRDELGVTEE